MAKKKQEEAKAEAATPEAAQAPSMKCLSQFIRDLSFENIAAQKNVGENLQPQIEVTVKLDAQKMGEDRYMVIMKLNVGSQDKDIKVFLMEIDYAGVFEVTGLPQEQLHPYLMIEAPRLMFPFVRQIVRNVTTDGGYPPLNIDMIDFLSLYRTELARQAEALKAQDKN